MCYLFVKMATTLNHDNVHISVSLWGKQSFEIIYSVYVIFQLSQLPHKQTKTNKEIVQLGGANL